MQTAIYRRQPVRLQLRAMDLAWHLGDVVRKLRLARHLSQIALGEKAGEMNKNTISRLEVGGDEAVTTETIKRVARALGVDVADLYALIPRRKDPPMPHRSARPADAFRETQYIGPDERRENLGPPSGLSEERGRGRRQG